MNLPSREQIEAELRWRAEHKLESFYPDAGLLRRELYVKHLEFFEAGSKYNERLFCAANRVGKTEGVGAYETALHLTGAYPKFWKGRRFSRPISAWAAGQTAKTTRDIVQLALLGDPHRPGTGMIPADAIAGTTPKAGIPEAVETIYVRHISGGRSDITLKSYDQQVESFYGTGKDVIWLDEEAPRAIYVEALTRTLSTRPGEPNGIILCTFTPLWGVTDVVKEFMQAGADSPKCMVTATWDDAPHLSPETRAELFKSIPPYQRDARTKGIPQLGSGAIYPIPESDFVIADFEIPQHWPRAYGFDVGWEMNACAFGARDRDNDCVYLTGEYYRGQAEPVVHAEGIRARGKHLLGFIDPAANGRSQIDGRRLLEIYRGLGLNLEMAQNAREAGIFAVWNRLSTGRLKVFRSCRNWLDEFRIFARDETGKIVNEQKFHLQAATRYLLLDTMNRWRTAPQPPKYKTVLMYPGSNELTWMQ